MDGGDFASLALEVFRFQAQYNATYSRYLKLLGVVPESVKALEQIPFLPVEAFKSNKVVTGEFIPEAVFKSSGTTDSTNRSEHSVRDVSWYHKVSMKVFSDIVRPVGGAEWFGLLPGYLERGDSSLVEMVRNFMGEKASDKRFFLHDYSELSSAVKNEIIAERDVCILGVTHAILDMLEGGEWLEISDAESEKLTIIETGGMKGHGREPIRSEVHDRINKAVPSAKILSEYGMTELLSQAYSLDGRFFESPSWMRVMIKDTSDPMTQVERGKTGRVQIIDLANLDSCAFISTSDLGRMEAIEGSNRFEILGRFDHSEVRGCNLLSVN